MNKRTKVISKKDKYLLYKIRSNQIMKRRIITLEEALKRTYYVKPQINNYGDYSSGRIVLPKCLNGLFIKIKVVKELKQNLGIK